MRLKATRRMSNAKTESGLFSEGLGSRNKLLSRAWWHQVGLLEHRCDCGGEKGQEGAGVEATSAPMKRRGDGSPPIWAGLGWRPETQAPLTPFSPAATVRGRAVAFPSSTAIIPTPAQAQVQLQLQQLILVTLGPEAGAGQPGSWPQLAGEPGLDSVIRRKPEPRHKL